MARAGLMAFMAIGLIFLQCFMMSSAYSYGKDIAKAERSTDDVYICRLQQEEALQSFKQDLEAMREKCDIG